MGFFFGTIVSWIIIALIVGMMWLFPTLGPWWAQQAGLSEFRQAEQNRLILIEQAEAEQQVARLRAEAERDAAALRAEAISIIGEAARQYPEYRTQEFIGAFAIALENGNIDQIIYVPTEASIPILEAGAGRVQQGRTP